VAVDSSEILLNQVPCAFYETIVNDLAFTQGIPRGTIRNIHTLHLLLAIYGKEIEPDGR